MRVIVVEDEDHVAAFVEQVVQRAFPLHDVLVVGDRDAALSVLANTDNLEFVVCDLRIPSSAGAADADEAYGRAVQAYLAANQPGVPCIFLSGYARNHIRTLSSSAAKGGVVQVSPGTSPLELVQVAEKDDLLDFTERLDALAVVVGSVDERKIECPLELGEVDERIIRLALANQNLALGEVGRIHLGIAGARTYRVIGPSPDGEAHLFVKIDQPSEIREELERYELHVTARLHPGHYAPLVAHIDSLAAGNQAIVFRFNNMVMSSLFDAVSGLEVRDVEQLRNALEPWASAATLATVSIKDLRRRRVDDGTLRSAGLLSERSVTSLESSAIETRVSCTHGDMHGENALVVPQGICLVDFADVGQSIACFDAVTLELSFWTHAKGRRVASGWPSKDQALRWWDLRFYLEDCPFPDFIRSCREWALETVDEDEAVVAAARYSHSVRQLKYSDVRPQLALASALGAAERWAHLRRSY